MVVLMLVKTRLRTRSGDLRRGTNGTAERMASQAEEVDFEEEVGGKQEREKSLVSSRPPR